MKYSLLIALLALVAMPAAAADGDNCATNRTRSGMYDMLCDSKVAADDPASCTQYQFITAPRIIEVEIAEDDGCSGSAAVAFTTQSATDTDVHNLTTWALTRGGTTAVTVEGSSAQPLAYLNTTASTLTGCTDFDVKMHIYY
jgi:hypothetical protein